MRIDVSQRRGPAGSFGVCSGHHLPQERSGQEAPFGVRNYTPSTWLWIGRCRMLGADPGPLDFCLRDVIRILRSSVCVPARIVAAEGDEVSDALLAHVGEVHRRTCGVVFFAMGG